MHGEGGFARASRSDATHHRSLVLAFLEGGASLVHPFGVQGRRPSDAKQAMQLKRHTGLCPSAGLCPPAPSKPLALSVNKEKQEKEPCCAKLFICAILLRCCANKKEYISLGVRAW
jgi:hypothetical protein